MTEQQAKHDPWRHEETGLADDFDATIANAYFATDSRYNKGQTLLLTLEAVSPDTEVGQQRIVYSCGNGWTTVDGGKTAKHETKGYNAGFHQSTAVRKFINRVLDFGPEVEAALRARDNDLGQLRADVWVGMILHFANERIEYGATSGLEARNRLMPNKFLGMAKGAVPAQEPVKEAAKPAAEPVAEVAIASGTGTTAKVKVQLIKIAKTAASYQDFIDAATEIPGVVDDEALMSELVDESETGFYGRYAKK